MAGTAKTTIPFPQPTPDQEEHLRGLMATATAPRTDGV